MSDQDKYAVLCWNCKNLAKCNPAIRPPCNGICENLKLIDRRIYQEEIAEWIGVSVDQVKTILRCWGAEKIVEMLSFRGHEIRYKISYDNDGNKIRKFYEIRS